MGTDSQMGKEISNQEKMVGEQWFY